jgi:putative membrane protein
LTALRFQLREPKPWENIKSKTYNIQYLKYYKVPEWETNLQDELKPFLSESELRYILSTKNRATQILAKQSQMIKELNEKGIITEYNYVAFENQIKDLYDQQGKCERIKNFPYPRQFSSINLYFTNLLCFLIPFGFIGELSKYIDTFGDWFVWLAIPLSIIVGWIFLVLT